MDGTKQIKAAGVPLHHPLLNSANFIQVSTTLRGTQELQAAQLINWMQELILERDISLSTWLPAQVCRLPDVPVTSSGRFLRAVTTGPSFLRKRGLLRLSATFCFSLDRNFRLGSDAEQEKQTVFWLMLFW